MDAKSFSKIASGAIILKNKFRKFFPHSTSSFHPDIFQNQSSFGQDKINLLLVKTSLRLSLIAPFIPFLLLLPLNPAKLAPCSLPSSSS
jgi:hypothetical protein